MVLNNKFNRSAAEGDFILARSEAAREARDLTSRDVFQQSASPSQNWAAMPKEGVTLQDRGEAYIKTSDDRSLAQKMQPEKSYEAPQVDTANLLRNSDKAVKDAPDVQKQAGMGLEQTAKTMAQFSADWNQAKGEAISALREAATEMNIDADLAEAQLTPSPQSTEMTAALTVAVDIAGSSLGGGSFVTFSAASFAARELMSESRPIGNETKEQLLAKVLDKLQSQSGSGAAPRDTRVDGGGGSGVIRDAIDTPERAVHWENLTTEDMEAFLGSDPYGQDQPEFAELEEAMEGQYGYQQALDNIEATADNYGEKFTADKFEAALERGDAEFVQEQPSFDSGNVILAGDMVMSIGGVKIDLSSNTPDFIQYVPSFAPQPKVLEREPEARQLLSVGI